MKKSFSFFHLVIMLGENGIDTFVLDKPKDMRGSFHVGSAHSHFSSMEDTGLLENPH